VRKACTASLVLVAALARLARTETISPVSLRQLESAASGITWLDSSHVIIAGPSGVRTLSLVDGTSAETISTKPVPHGLPDPLSVTTDGVSVVASNGFTRSQFACRAMNRQRLFARSSPLFLVIDLAVSGQKLYLLGWPVDANGANNGEGIAVWQGGLSSAFEKFEPLHRIQSGASSVAIFNDSLPVYGGALAIESDGTLDVITAAESGVFQYSPEGSLRRTLGTGLGELVMRRMHDINFTYGDAPLARYQKVVNRQPTIDGLVATLDGPAIVVRTVNDEIVQWELWYPNDVRIDRRIKLAISRRGPFGHLSCGARMRDLACVYQAPATSDQALDANQRNIPTFLVQFKLPPRHEEPAAHRTGRSQ
jgi:hypothetical protein